MPLEIEVKFYLESKEISRNQILNRIAALGGRSSGAVFERNIRFEDKGCSLLEKKSLLRLRKDRRTRLTFKSETVGMSGEDQNNFKIFNELEVDVSDFSTMVRILEALGFHQAQIYEKWRETFAVGNSLICMDTMPFGEFLEIEGPREEIPKLAAEIGLDWNRRILENYLGIFARLKHAMSLPFNNITFDHFKHLPNDISPEHFSSCIRRHEFNSGD